MKGQLILIVILLTVIVKLSSQNLLQKSIQNHRHGFLLTTNTALSGSAIKFRPGLGIGYGYFKDKYNLKSLIEYSRWSEQKEEYSINEFRFNFRYEYERYLSNWFSITTFLTPDFRYNDQFYPDNDPRNVSEVTFALGLGICPRIYQVSDHFYYSFGLDLPLLETGYFQGDGPDPDLDDLDTFRQGIDTRLLSREVRAHATFGYRF
ncbi:hypothetical protein [Portibacter marinus]|uniref:hypothetical protein n=1 Tax=Portibacter marinus TaxID=2898660 RepID=UPI001F355167|nr:hypothetical protein [Portibacter marinus]